ncbi:unnamed protein product (macronuclear) [Paramecium tetraurelia]|uniref:Uncharacterized protein n=1 Tax=Paramecium tetraurelia TaxID=5888 RepID=A0CLZ3_PARTE|nr:uncharacterized protein GSPATT00008289001 [Paramecium tetraurelia]CAK71810.1 unnamed protein product [Paramecium tetraurelia]|eukprot:XP_001439207.1 hypothetical protein (macronuclear) [Paramecium tetraurelia strain d4-2]
MSNQDSEPEIDDSDLEENSRSRSSYGNPIEDQDEEMDTSQSKGQESVTSDSSDDEDENQIIRTGAMIQQSKGRKVLKNERITPPFLTKYERARVIGTRALQISKNSPIYVDPKETTDPIQVAQQELNENKIPFIIRRYLPNGNFEDWELQELERLD